MRGAHPFQRLSLGKRLTLLVMIAMALSCIVLAAAMTVAGDQMLYHLCLPDHRHPWGRPVRFTHRRQGSRRQRHDPPSYRGERAFIRGGSGPGGEIQIPD